MEEKRDARGLTESEAIARYRSRNYPKPALTADIIVLHPDTEGTKVLLVERGGHPFIGKLALPGGFGTLEELSEIIVQKQLGYNNKPIVILNTDGTGNLLKTINSIYGTEVSRNMFEVSGENDDYYVNMSIAWLISICNKRLL